MMRVGGNDKFTKFMQSNNIPKSTPIVRKYNSPAAHLYREQIRALAEGREPPSQLPTQSHHVNQSSHSNSSVDASGSEPLPGESESQYIARQKRLQEEVPSHKLF